jgi:hypothetical protein
MELWSSIPPNMGNYINKAHTIIFSKTSSVLHPAVSYMRESIGEWQQQEMEVKIRINVIQIQIKRERGLENQAYFHSLPSPHHPSVITLQYHVCQSFSDAPYLSSGGRWSVCSGRARPLHPHLLTDCFEGYRFLRRYVRCPRCSRISVSDSAFLIAPISPVSVPTLSTRLNRPTA